MHNRKIQAVVFDFNGTLFWDTHLHNEAWDIFLEKHGLSLTDGQKHEFIHGRNNKETFTTLFSGNLTLGEITAHHTEKEQIYRDLCLQTDMKLAPGAEDFIEYLHDRGITFTIATASAKVNVDFFFKQFKLDRYFSIEKVTYDDGEMKSKPDPEIFLRAMGNIGAEPESTLIFEDSVAGIGAAENSGAGKIIIVNSTGADYSAWDLQVITGFDEVNREMF